MADPPKLTVEEWLVEQKRLEEKVFSAQQAIADHKRRCSHRFSNGETTLPPTGYGDAMCRTCRTQTD
jgi:hypothetical protein